MDAPQAEGPGDDARPAPSQLPSIPQGKPVRVEYFSRDMALPPGFLSPTGPPPPDARPMTLTPIDWTAPRGEQHHQHHDDDGISTTAVAAALPENEGRFAVVLEHVLSPSECQTLLRLAEASVDLPRANAFWRAAAAGDDAGHEPSGGGGGGGGPGGAAAAARVVDEGDPWRPAMVNAGAGTEVLDTWYRDSDRIVWDSEEVAGRLWARCLGGGGGGGGEEVGERLRAALGALDGARDEGVVGPVRRAKLWGLPPQRWEMRGLNRRLRFLRYGPGQFFRPHCDGNFSEVVDGRVFKTFFTVHLYLNDSVAEAGEAAELVGGATSFLSSNGARKMDVDPKAGRVLIFQQRGLNHAGDDVVKGTKYTMRSEIMYELIRPDEPEGEQVKT